MRVDKTMIHPELGRAASAIRLMLPSFTCRKLRVVKALEKVMRGRCFSKLRYEQIYLPRDDGSKLRLCIYSPLSPARNVPGLLWFHGGGYAIGYPEQDERLIRQFVEASGCVVVAPDYTLSLDQPYPAAFEDGCATLLWLRDNGVQYGMRADQIFVGGRSAGGGLAAAVALYARDSGEVNVAFQMPLYPMLDDRLTESSRDNDAPLWNAKSNEVAWKLYLGGLFGKPEVPAYAAPGRNADYQGLAPACTFVGSIEPFRDETMSYMENLRRSGVPVHCRVFDGCFHAFDVACGNTSVGQEAAAFLMDTFMFAVKNYFSEPANKAQRGVGL